MGLEMASPSSSNSNSSRTCAWLVASVRVIVSALVGSFAEHHQSVTFCSRAPVLVVWKE